MNRTKGSISIEASISCFTCIIIMFVLFSVLQLVYVRNLAEKVALGVSEDVSRYSCVLYKSGLLSLKDSVRAKAISSISSENSTIGKVLSELFDFGINEISDEMFSLSLGIIANEKLKNELKEKNLPFTIYVDSLKGSEFINNDNEFRVKVTLKSNLIFPVIFKEENYLKASSVVLANAWLYGGTTRYTADEINVWELSNYKRGIVLKHVFNGNLPDCFPEIDIFDEETGLATKICSIDTTVKTYDTPGKIKNRVQEYARSLSKWNGGKYLETEIKGEDIKKKEILLIIPDNILSEIKMRELLDAANSASTLYGIKVYLKNYQHSGEQNN